MVTYHYRPPRIAQVQGPPESVLSYLRTLRCYLDPKGIARILKCHQESVYLLIAQAGLPAEKHGRCWRIDPIKFAVWLESRGFAPAATPEQADSREKGGRGTGQ